MTLRLNRNSGKGDRRRATQNDEAYRSNYDSIFGKKTKGENKAKEEVSNQEISDILDASQVQKEV